MLGIVEILLGLGLLALISYYYLNSNYTFWISRGVDGPKPSILFGNFKDVIFGKHSMTTYIHSIYPKYKNKPMFGIFARNKPILIVNDFECIKNILIKDFRQFSERGIRVHEKVEPLSQHLFSLDAKRWRPLRIQLSPAFTSGKLKGMFYLLLECGEHFGSYLERCVQKDPIIECRELTAKFTTDVIGVCAFGLKMNAVSDEDSEFRKVGRQVFVQTPWKIFQLNFKQSFPWLYDLLAPIFYDSYTNDFFINLVKDTVDHREKNGIRRNDFLDLLMDIKANPSKFGEEMTDTLITAQAFVFFIAGFETSSSTMSNALYELALNQTIQDKLRIEINEVLYNNNGELTYDGIKNMKFLDKIFNETLRKYPVLGVLMRKSLEQYTFSKNQVTIPKGTSVFIPAYSLHRDSKIYPNPDIFDPERFDENNQINQSIYIPFGDGPRNCIGARFANYQTKLGVIKIIQKFNVNVCDKSPNPYVISPKHFLLAPLNGITLKFTKI